MILNILQEFNKDNTYVYNSYLYNNIKDLFYVFCVTNNFENLCSSASTMTFSDDNYVYQLVDGDNEWKLFQSNHINNKYCANCTYYRFNDKSLIISKKYGLLLDQSDVDGLSNHHKLIVQIMIDSYYSYFNNESCFDKKSQLLLIDNIITICNVFGDDEMKFIFNKVKELVSKKFSIDFKIENILLTDNNTPIFWDIVYK